MLVAQFLMFNRLAFDNRIYVMPQIIVYQSKVNMGFFEGEADDFGRPMLTIKISERQNKNWQDVCETLLHEMVHCFQYLNKLPVDHGKYFKQIKKEIKQKYGLTI